MSVSQLHGEVLRSGDIRVRQSEQSTPFYFGRQRVRSVPAIQVSWRYGLYSCVHARRRAVVYLHVYDIFAANRSMPTILVVSQACRLTQIAHGRETSPLA